jgi:hypothetical protein
MQRRCNSHHEYAHAVSLLPALLLLQDLMTPQSHTSSAIGSAIRAAGAVAGPLQLSPAMPDSMPEASPTLMLIPGQGYENTVGLQVRMGLELGTSACPDKFASGLCNTCDTWLLLT